MVVYARRDICVMSGSSRAVREGKKYPGAIKAQASWADGMRTAVGIFNLIVEAEKKIHAQSYLEKGSTFGIVRNNYLDPDMEASSPEYAACSANLMAAMNCRVATAPKMSLYTPAMLQNAEFKWQWEARIQSSAGASDAIMTLNPRRAGVHEALRARLGGSPSSASAGAAGELTPRESTSTPGSPTAAPHGFWGERPTGRVPDQLDPSLVGRSSSPDVALSKEEFDAIRTRPRSAPESGQLKRTEGRRHLKITTDSP